MTHKSSLDIDNGRKNNFLSLKGSIMRTIIIVLAILISLYIAVTIPHKSLARDNGSYDHEQNNHATYLQEKEDCHKTCYEALKECDRSCSADSAEKDEPTYPFEDAANEAECMKKCSNAYLDCKRECPKQ